VRLNPLPGDKSQYVVCIYEHPGFNYLPHYIDNGPAWFRVRKVGDAHTEHYRNSREHEEPIPLEVFLDFAVGAAECLELLHNGQHIVHGEIRGDAFHLNIETGSIKLINFGSGLRTFEHGLTSTGWSALSKDVGAKTKLSFMSPEQTGRMPAEPDSRTDIYSLGILFWTLLTQQPAFEGDTPMDIIQGVLSRRLPKLSNFRLNVPDVLCRIIQKMTAKAIHERYHSASGLRHDLLEVRRLLSLGDAESLQNWEIATKDVSSFFVLPDIMVGRTEEHDRVVKVIDKVAKRHLVSQLQDISMTSDSNLSEGRLETFVATSALLADLSSEGDNGSSGEAGSSSLGTTGLFPGDPRPYKSGASQIRSSTNSMNNSMEGQDMSSRSNASIANLKLWEKNSMLEARSMVESTNSDIAGSRSTNSDSVGTLSRHRNAQKFRRKGRCEVVSISGAAGLGKSCLVQSVQVEARKRGYFASSKFDQAKKMPFGPVLKLLSSLFKQVFSESNTNTPFHQILKQYVRPAWPMLHKILLLPEFLLGPINAPTKPTHSSGLSQSYNKRLMAEHNRPDSPPTSSPASIFNAQLGTQSVQDFLRAGAATKSVRLMNTFLEVLRVFAQHKFICFCLDDLQFADDESLDLIAQIVSSGIKMVIIVTYRPDEILPEKIRGIIEPPNTEGIRLPHPFLISLPS
jgi:serine/threonine protein kinase